MKKKVIIFLVGFCAFLFLTQREKATEELVEEHSKTVKKVVVKNSSSETEEELNYLEQKEQLEQPDSAETISASQKEEIKELLAETQKVIKETKMSELYPDKGNNLLLTDGAVVTYFGTALLLKEYEIDLDGIEVYSSDNSDVLQVMFSMSAEGEETMYWVGNYNIIRRQFQLTYPLGGNLVETFG